MDEDRNSADSRSVAESLSEDSTALEERTTTTTTTQDFEGWQHALTDTKSMEGKNGGWRNTTTLSQHIAPFLPTHTPCISLSS